MSNDQFLKLTGSPEKAAAIQKRCERLALASSMTMREAADVMIAAYIDSNGRLPVDNDAPPTFHESFARLRCALRELGRELRKASRIDQLYDWLLSRIS